jgi:DnaJ-class molecular chaperone
MSYYKLLGVHRESTAEEVEQAFRKLAWRHHPDQGGEPETFASLSHAKATLTHEKLKNDYDRMLMREFMECACCAGRGCHFRQKSFTERVNTPCGECGGAGVIN